MEKQLESTSPTPEVMASRTRSGRVVKPPVRYTPQEICDDDYASNEYDSDESESVSSEVSYDSEDVSDESDADEEGNLEGFIVKTSSDSDDNDGPKDIPSESGETDVSDEPRPAPVKRGAGRPRTLVL